MASQRYVSPVAEAIIYIGLGDHKRALDRLERAYQTGSSMLFWMKVDHYLRPASLRSALHRVVEKGGTRQVTA